MRKPTPYNIFSVKENSEMLMNFHIFIYNSDYPIPEDNVGSTVDLNLASVRIVYMH